MDYVCIDLQHGGATEHDLPELTSAIRLAGAAPLGRVRHAHPADIGRALDLGCDGVIVPNVDSAEQARSVVGACRFPPDGYRSAGGVLATPELPLCILMVESQSAMADLPETLKIPGVDGIYMGPRDLSPGPGPPAGPDRPGAAAGLRARLGAVRRGGQAGSGCTPRTGRPPGCTGRTAASLVTVVNDNMAIKRESAGRPGRGQGLSPRVGEAGLTGSHSGHVRHRPLPPGAAATSWL